MYNVNDLSEFAKFCLYLKLRDNEITEATVLVWELSKKEEKEFVPHEDYYYGSDDESFEEWLDSRED
jgi:hypothetical protein